MENSTFKRICNKIDYNTYKNIENILPISIIGLAVSNDLLTKQYTTLNTSVDILTYSMLLSQMFLYFSHGENYTNNVTQIKTMYNEFINNYNELNNTFELENPIQIYTMFNYLLYKGYLSKDKQYTFSSENTRDVLPINGTNILLGQGVCRHISSFLKDILDDYGINSYNLCVYNKELHMDVKILDKPKYTIEELYNWVRTHITDENSYNQIIKLINIIVNENKQNIEISAKEVDVKNPIERLYGNNAIVYTTYNDKSYYLDATQKRVYRISEQDKNMLYDKEGAVALRINSSILSNKFKEFRNLKKEINKQYPSISIEQENKLVSETLDICKKNTDIFENFYNDNNELYNEISNKVLSIKKRKFI